MKTKKNQGLLQPLVIATIIFLIASSSMNSILVKPLLNDGTLIRHGRFSITFDAWDTVSEEDGFVYVAIGSSITRASFDGNCVEDVVNLADLEFFNLGLSASNPYTTMTQLSSLLNAGPDVVILELGVNSLWDLNNEQGQWPQWQSDDDYIEFRFKLDSMLMNSDDFGDWVNLVREDDKKYLNMNQIDRMMAWQTYTVESSEEVLRRVIDNESGAALEGHWFNAPTPKDSNWKEYLSTPNYRENGWGNSTEEELQPWFDENFPTKVTYGEYNPHHDGTLFHSVFEFMIDEIIEQNIKVILYSGPRHPMVFNYFTPGQTDGLNTTLDYFSNIDGVYILNVLWDEWDIGDFLDWNHLDDDGRKKMCEKMGLFLNTIEMEGA
tara:strand:+ start:160 stop:1296 length:1137 start_codon:yes stop_codon:yes gene_type:complete